MPITFPDVEDTMGDVLAALGGNFGRWQQLKLKDMHGDSDLALEYAIAFFSPFASEFPQALQGAIDAVARLRQQDREGMINIVVAGDVPAYLRAPNAVHAMSDDVLRHAAINQTFHAELDRAGEGKAELALFRFLPDGTRKMWRIGIRDSL